MFFSDSYRVGVAAIAGLKPSTTFALGSMMDSLMDAASDGDVARARLLGPCP